MANSLVYWVQDLWRGGFLGQGSKIYAMTSEGSTRVVPSYGVVSSAKAALESHIRQLAMELARHGTGATANCIRAGVTITPALLKIPEAQTMIDITMKRNPTGRMTTPQDVANAILALSGDGHRVHQRRHHQRRRRRVRHGLVEVGRTEGRGDAPASHRPEVRPGHRRRVGQRRPGRHDRATAGARRDGHRRPVRAPPRRKGRQPGGRGGAARRDGVVRRGGRRRRVRGRGAGRARGRRGRRRRAADAARRADRRGPDPRRRGRREQHRGRRRRERGADLGPGAGRIEAARPRHRGRRAGRPRDPDRAPRTRRSGLPGWPARLRSSTRHRPAASAGRPSTSRRS